MTEIKYTKRGLGWIKLRIPDKHDWAHICDTVVVKHLGLTLREHDPAYDAMVKRQKQAAAKGKK